MAKRGGGITLTVLNSQDQWNGAIKRPGLTLCDVYSQCWGPCVAIQTCFKQLMTEFGDTIKIALAESDEIEELSQFRGKSQPLFVLYYSGTPVAFLKGANQPKLLRLVRKQVEMQDNENREIVNVFEQATEEEEELAASMSRTVASETQLTEFTVAVIKPDAVSAGYVNDIINELNANGLIVVSQEEHLMTGEEVHNFYKHLENEPYFLKLVEYMTSGPCVAIVVAKVTPGGKSVVEMLKKLRGNKDVVCAKQEDPDSLRARFGSTSDSGVYTNAIHASDNSDVAAEELAFFFPNFQSSHNQLERTICVIRPDTNKAYKETILKKLEEQDFKIALQKEFVMSREMAEVFYRKQKDQPFFDALINQMISGPSTVLALCAKDAVKRWRKYLGPTVVSEAKEQEPDSMRAQFTTDDTINGLHGSGSSAEAAHELNFFFPPEQTLAVIKPDMMDKKDEIIARIEEAGIVIQAQKDVNLSKDTAGQFYEEHKNKQFYGDLCDYMVSGKSTFLVLSSDNAVEKWREIMGPTDPAEAKINKPQSLRSKLGNDVLKNGLHGASTEEHAMKSIALIFGESMSIHSSSSTRKKNLSSLESQAKDSSQVTADDDKTENDVISLTTDTPRSTTNDVSDNPTLQGEQTSLTELTATNELLTEETAVIGDGENEGGEETEAGVKKEQGEDEEQGGEEEREGEEKQEGDKEEEGEEEQGGDDEDRHENSDANDVQQSQESAPLDDTSHHDPQQDTGEAVEHSAENSGPEASTEDVDPLPEPENPEHEAEKAENVEELKPELPAENSEVASADPEADVAAEPVPDVVKSSAEIPAAKPEPIPEPERSPQRESPTPSTTSLGSILSFKSKMSLKERIRASLTNVKSKFSNSSLKSQKSRESLKSQRSNSSLKSQRSTSSLIDAVQEVTTAQEEDHSQELTSVQEVDAALEATPPQEVDSAEEVDSTQEVAPAPEMVMVEESVAEVTPVAEPEPDSAAEENAAKAATDEDEEQADEEAKEDPMEERCEEDEELEAAESRIRDNLSEGLSPILESHEDYLDESFDSDDTAARGGPRNTTPQEIVESEECDTELEDSNAEPTQEVDQTDDEVVEIIENTEPVTPAE